MKYKKIRMNSGSGGIHTELAFDIAAGRADGIELLELEIPLTDDTRENSRLIATLKRSLKDLKQQGRIQFFAFPDNFRRQGTESVYLINKYPELFASIPAETEELTLLFVKL